MAVILAVAAGVLLAALALAGKNLRIQLQRLCVYFSYPGQMGRLLTECCEELEGMLHLDSGSVLRFAKEQAARLED